MEETKICIESKQTDTENMTEGIKISNETQTIKLNSICLHLLDIRDHYVSLSEYKDGTIFILKRKKKYGNAFKDKNLIYYFPL